MNCATTNRAAFEKRTSFQGPPVCSDAILRRTRPNATCIIASLVSPIKVFCVLEWESREHEEIPKQKHSLLQGEVIPARKPVSVATSRAQLAPTGRARERVGYKSANRAFNSSLPTGCAKSMR